MAEMYADFKEINEVAQTIMGSFGRTDKDYWGSARIRDASNMQVEDYDSLQRGLSFKPAEQALYSISQAELMAGAGSLAKHGFDTEIGAIVEALKQGNEAIEGIGLFLNKLIESFERSEAELMALFGNYGVVKEEDKAWIEDYLDPMGTDVQQRGLYFALTGDAEWSSLLATGEDGTVGIDACFMDETKTTTYRDESGKRVSDISNARLLCLTAKVGKGEYSKGEKYGFDISGTIASTSTGYSEVGSVALSKGEGLTVMKSINDDGTADVTLGVPTIPVTLTAHGNVGHPSDRFSPVTQSETQAKQQR